MIFLFSFIITLDAQVNRREVGNLVIEDIPELPADFTERMKQYQNARSASFAGWDSDGKGMYIITRFAETAQIHHVSRPGAYRRQVTFFSEPVAGLAVRPSNKEPGFLFSKDIGGNEMYQIYYFNEKDSKYEMLTDGKSRNASFLWSKDGQYFAYMSNKRNGKDFDIYLADMSNLKNHKMIYESAGQWSPEGFSPDGKSLLIHNYISITDSKIYILDIASGKKTPLLDTKEPVAMSSPLWRDDGKGIYYMSDNESEFNRLVYYDLEKKTHNVITNSIDWDIEAIVQSKGTKKLAFIANENGSNKLYMLDPVTHKYTQSNVFPPCLFSGMEFSENAKHLAVSMNSSKTSGDVFVLDFSTNKPIRWTYSEVGGLNTDEFVEPTLIQYPTFDQVNGKQRMIPAYYYKPKGSGPFPVVVVFHGGPEAQFQPGFAATYQYWLNELGVAVICPNVRGSAGYGKTYLQLDNGFLRENSVKDGGALLDWIAKQPELDVKKIAVFGGSYGGYMVLAMMTHYNDRLAGAVDVVGISNFVTFLQNTSEYRRDLRRVEYGDERDPKMLEFLTKISPANSADKIKKPMLIVQGLNDPRVPASEAEQIVAAVRKNGGKAWYLLAKDEGHGFAKKSNRDYYTNVTAYFFKTLFGK